ncbi:MAG: bacillithiol biosynthesis deacetylase BshB1 [Flavobacteriales bacterium]|nr:bacillithiol biosynthesis deacetylase BshB1 [Flavobacteriales bacterium]
MKLDILAIGVHPDDVELSCSGTILKHIAQGKKVGILDLTQGELGSRGNAALRLQEAAKAAEIQGVAIRENLGFADGFFENNPAHQIELIKIIRKYQPDVVLANAVSDRHPDHGRASELISESCFYSGLVKIETELDGQVQEKWRPKAVYHYIQDRYIKPDFVVDVTPYAGTKMKAILAFSSQFYDPDSTAPETPISGKDFLHVVEAKMAILGREIGVKYAEGFTVERIPGVEDLTTLL